MRTFLILILTLANFTLYAADKAPQWQLYNEQGQLVSSADFKGQPLVLHFWATWCPYCKRLQPGLDKLYKKYQPQGLKMLAVSWWEDEGAEPQAVLDARGLSFSTVINGDTVAREKFLVEGTPTTFFIDRQGNILGKTRISDPEDPRLEQAIKRLLAIEE